MEASVESKNGWDLIAYLYELWGDDLYSLWRNDLHVSQDNNKTEKKLPKSLTDHCIREIKKYINLISADPSPDTCPVLYHIAIINNHYNHVIVEHNILVDLFVKNIDHTIHLCTEWIHIFPNDYAKIVDIISEYPMRDRCGAASSYVNQEHPQYEKIIESVITNNCINEFVNAMYRMDKEFTIEKFYDKYCYNFPDAKIGILL